MHDTDTHSPVSTSPDRASVLLTGGSSQLGVFLIPRLLNAGFSVVAISRKATGEGVLARENPVWMNPESLWKSHGNRPEALTRIQMLVSCGPLDLACAALSACSGLQRVVIFSTSSIFSKVQSPNRKENEQIADILAGEATLKNLCEARGLALLILRPTLIYGCGLDRNISLLAAWIRRHRWLPLAGAAKGLRQPVHADDLAGVVVTALTVDKPVTMDSPACGGSTVSYRQMAGLIFDSLALPRRMPAVPTPILAAAVGILSMLRAFRGVNREMVLRQNTDLVFDDSALRQALNYQPRKFKPTTADFEIPATAIKYQLQG